MVANTDNPMPDFDHLLDVRGLNCPLPILHTKKTLSRLKPGEVLKVLTTDRGAEIDFKVFAELTGNKLIWFEDTPAQMTFFLRKKG